MMMEKEIHSSPGVAPPSAARLYADVSSFCAAAPPVQGPKSPSAQLPVSVQEHLLFPWTFFSSGITKDEENGFASKFVSLVSPLVRDLQSGVIFKMFQTSVSLNHQ